MLGDVDLVRDDGAVQALVEQQVGVAREILPRREGADAARRSSSASSLVVDVVARAARAVLAVAAEHLLELVAADWPRAPKWLKWSLPRLLRLRHRPFHLGAVVAMEGVALDEGGGDVLAAEDVLEGAA